MPRGSPPVGPSERIKAVQVELSTLNPVGNGAYLNYMAGHGMTSFQSDDIKIKEMLSNPKYLNNDNRNSTRMMITSNDNENQSVTRSNRPENSPIYDHLDKTSSMDQKQMLHEHSGHNMSTGGLKMVEQVNQTTAVDSTKFLIPQ